MAVIEFGRSGVGGRKSGMLSDIRVFATKCGRNNRYGIGIRVSGSVMKRMRWLPGDFVRAHFDDDSMTWTIQRVSSSDDGNKLSTGGKEHRAACTVRFAISGDCLKKLGLSAGVGGGYDCTLQSSDAEIAVFKVD